MHTVTEKPLSVRKRIRGAMAGVFIIALFVPLIGTILGWDTKSTENRPLAIFPAVPRKYSDATKFTDRGLVWFRDHFGFRNAMIHGVALLKYHGGLGTDTEGTVV